MTALKPIENRRVRAVASERYPLNRKCAHPECNEGAVDPHHGFPRSAIGGDSWFVEILEERNEPDHELAAAASELGIDIGEEAATTLLSTIIPHVTGLCRAHHDAVEEHEAWIKLEEGVWVWYDRREGGGSQFGCDGAHDIEEECDRCAEWEDLGPLNPQPGSVEGKQKRKRFKGEKRRKRATISIRVPQDEQEDGAGLWDEAIETLEAKISGDDPRPPYYTIMSALQYTILNADETDF